MANAAPLPVAMTRRIWMLDAALAACVVGAVMIGHRHTPTTVPGAGTFFSLLVLAILVTQLRGRTKTKHASVSLLGVIMLAASIVDGPLAAALIGIIATLSRGNWSGRAATAVFNGLSSGATGAAAGAIYLLAGGRPFEGGAVPLDFEAPQLLLTLGLPMLVAHVLSIVLINLPAMAAMYRIRKQDPPWHYMGELLKNEWYATFVAQAPIAFLFVLLWASSGWGLAGALLMFVPLIAAQRALWRAGLTRVRRDEAMAVFPRALEHYEPSTAGHSERVADLAVRISHRMKISNTESLHQAALLHDLGLVVEHETHQSDPGAGMDRYLGHVSAHPQAGAAALHKVGFLTDVLDSIIHHHERWDGNGYPGGLAGTDIPLHSRVIAVADAYDAYTSDQAQHVLTPDEAMAELRARSGTLFDPDVVEAFEQALTHGSIPDRPAQARSIPRPYRPVARPNVADHDLPAISDAYAAWQPHLTGLER